MSRSSIPEKLNICLVGSRFPIQSRATDLGFLWPIARSLAKRGHRVTVLSTYTPTGKNEVQRDGVRAFYLLEGASKQARQARFADVAYTKFLQLHRENPFHIVHSLDSSAYKIGRHKRNHGVKVSYDVEATQLSQLFSIMGMGQESISALLTTWTALAYKFLSTYFGGDRALLSTADGVFVTSPQQRVILERYYLYPDFHIYTVPYGIELSNLKERADSLDFRLKLGISESTNVIVTFSDFTESRDLLYVLNAFEKVVIKKPNTQLIIVGNGPVWKDIEFQMLNLALGNKVLMPGTVSSEEVLNYIMVSDVYIDLSSKTSGFAPTMLEAMAQKKVIIGSEISPISYVVEDGKDGFLLRPADRESLSQLIVEIFSGNIAVQEIGERAREKVLSLFDIEKMADSTLNAYFHILKNPRSN